MKFLKHDVQHAPDGKTAVALAASFEPALIFVDIGLPDISGFEVAKQLRENKTTAKLIALTGYDCEQKAIEAGFDRYFKKPYDFTNMNELVP